MSVRKFIHIQLNLDLYFALVLNECCFKIKIRILSQIELLSYYFKWHVLSIDSCWYDYGDCSRAGPHIFSALNLDLFRYMRSLMPGLTAQRQSVRRIEWIFSKRDTLSFKMAASNCFRLVLWKQWFLLN